MIEVNSILFQIYKCTKPGKILEQKSEVPNAGTYRSASWPHCSLPPLFPGVCQASTWVSFTTWHASRWHQFLWTNREIITHSLGTKTQNNTKNTTRAPQLKVAISRHKRMVGPPIAIACCPRNNAHIPKCKSHRRCWKLCNQTLVGLPKIEET